MKDLVEYLIKSIVNNPDDVIVEEVEITSYDGRSSTVFNVKLNPEDIGTVIGKGGKTIKSMRSIVKIRAIKEKKFVDIKIVEDKQPDEL